MLHYTQKSRHLSQVYLNNNIDAQISENDYFLFLSFFQVGYLAVTSCDGSTKHGPDIYIDFYKINRPCSCTVITSFNGDLLVVSMKGIGRICETQVTVVTVYNYRYMFNCQASEVSAVLHVKINQSVSVLAEYSSLSTSGAFYHCFRFIENGTITSLLEFMFVMFVF